MTARKSAAPRMSATAKAAAKSTASDARVKRDTLSPEDEAVLQAARRVREEAAALPTPVRVLAEAVVGTLIGIGVGYLGTLLLNFIALGTATLGAAGSVLFVLAAIIVVIGAIYAAFKIGMTPYAERATDLIESGFVKTGEVAKQGWSTVTGWFNTTKEA